MGLDSRNGVLGVRQKFHAGKRVLDLLMAIIYKISGKVGPTDLVLFYVRCSSELDSELK